MPNLSRHEGYMYVDNRNSPGVDDALLVKLGYPVGAGKGLFEAATYTCSHCNSIVIIEPKRTRERAVCTGCGQRICDACSVTKQQTMVCYSMAQKIDELRERDAKQVAPAAPSILLTSGG